MTHSDLYDKFIKQLEAEYVGTYIDSDRKSVRMLLERRVRSEEATLSFAMFAVKQWASKLKGLPDCATIRQAIDKYEEEYTSSLRPKGDTYQPIEDPPDNPTDAEKTRRLLNDLKTIGISIDTPNFMTKVFKLRLDRGDYGHNPKRGGVIHNMDDITKPKQGVTWGELGVRHEREGVRV